MKRRAVIASLGWAPFNGLALANEPQSILTISGSVGMATAAVSRTFAFTRSRYLSLPQRAITTATSWTPRSTFVGPTVLDVMRVADVHGGTLHFKSLDDNSVPVPWADIVRYGVILAHSQDGVPLSIKRWGPLWLIYPKDQYPDELQGPVADSRFIWQVVEIRVEQ